MASASESLHRHRDRMLAPEELDCSEAGATFAGWAKRCRWSLGFLESIVSASKYVWSQDNLGTDLEAHAGRQTRQRS